MKIEIVSRKNNPLLGKEEVELRISHHGQSTPSRQELVKEISSHLKAKEDCMIIDKIVTLHGEAVSKAKVLVYDKPEIIPSYKLEKMKKRMKSREAEEK